MKRVVFFFFLVLIVSDFRAQSDSKAIQIADKIVEAMGGLKNYEKAQCLQWTFMGRRHWIWDKSTGDVRCDVVSDDTRIALNINSKKGSVYAHGVLQTDPDSLTKFLDLGYRLWINDSYWLVMPWKLQDPGTTLSYKGQKENSQRESCELLELTFSEVGVTPDNKYWLYVDPATSLIVQWDYFTNYNDEGPRLSTPWTDYREYGAILLSGGRGKSEMSNIQVYRKPPVEALSDIEQQLVDLLNYD